MARSPGVTDTGSFTGDQPAQTGTVQTNWCVSVAVGLVVLTGCATTINQNAPVTSIGAPVAVPANDALQVIIDQRPDGTWRERLVSAEIIGEQLVVKTTLNKGDVPRALLICEYADSYWTKAGRPVTSSRVLDVDGNTLVRRRGPDKECGTGNDLNG
jgi:hypothetical protein